MPRYLSADYIFPISSEPIKDGIIMLHESGEILDVFSPNQFSDLSAPIEYHKGIIVPGFVNAHCHLELSHMLGKIPQRTGLVSFIKSVITQRAADEAEALEAMKIADQSMFDNGIVAVGDISNMALSASVKRNSKIFYHTFIELLGFDPQRAKMVFQKAMELQTEFLPLKTSIAPHAPYSVSKQLFGLLKSYSDEHNNLFSMHNQESEPENEFFLSKKGSFIDFYKILGLNIDFFEAQGQTSLQSVLPLISDNQKVLLVHNTFTNAEDIAKAKESNKELNWCFCPNANQYIEGQLPDIELFINSGFNITLGTDSLASNEKLCILSEMQSIKKYFPHLPTSEMMKWATINGAQFLGIDKTFGSIEKGKIPGLNLISGVEGMEIGPFSKVMRLI
ncbi:amidohydrolase family protein [Daejeonella sp.]|uniref:amidohydrolase family protein n=1 Tax=Daejeonella sp. TaxID=2805397 RepID=UPI0025BD44A3|nr:amidohydrolase family protein [Daejeonella sp.]